MKKEEQFYDYSFTEKEVIAICDALDYFTEDLERIAIIARSKDTDITKLNDIRVWTKMFRFKIFDKFANERKEK